MVYHDLKHAIYFNDNEIIIVETFSRVSVHLVTIS